jgi:hypothetical protein
MRTPDGNNEQCLNYEITVNKRMSGRWMLLGSFNWTGQPFLQNGVPANPLMAYNNYVKDSYWTSHFSGIYQDPWGMLISPILRMQQGQPTDRTYTIAGLRVGSYALIAEPFGAWRVHSRHRHQNCDDSGEARYTQACPLFRRPV